MLLGNYPFIINHKHHTPYHQLRRDQCTDDHKDEQIFSIDGNKIFTPEVGGTTQMKDNKLNMCHEKVRNNQEIRNPSSLHPRDWQ